LPNAPDLAPTVRAAGETWTSTDAEQTYSVPLWGSGYFFVNDRGHAVVRPDSRSPLTIDIHSVAERLTEQGVRFPALVRFQDLLQARVRELNESFERAIEASGYRNRYQGVFPIKVNQLREVVEEILDAGVPYDFGLECGSKSELVAALPFLEQYDTILLCNGCKDRRMMDLMVAAQVLGRRVFPIVERYEEFDMLNKAVRAQAIARAEGPVGAFGVRVRLSASGAGLWSESGGANSKFGISLTELIRLVEALDERGHLDRFQLLHFHLGSQIADVGNVEAAVREAARIFIWLREKGVEVRYIDIGGGLGVNYEAGNPEAIGHINYELDDYTHAVVGALTRAFDEAGVNHPIIISESGRAITAHHSVLIVEAIGRRGKDRLLESEIEAEHELVGRLHALYVGSQHETTNGTTAAYSEAVRLRDEIDARFREGSITLEDKAYAERIFWSLSRLACHHVAHDDTATSNDDLQWVEPLLVDHYLCDFSVFRSMVDYWAIGQRFPIMPIHRLDEKPSRRGMIDDLTCDSDGRISDFVSPEGDKHYLELHPLREGEPYYLGFFLMGAYQDIMGDMHNLFGRVTEAHVYLDDEEPDGFYVEKIIDGATVREQLELVQYHANDLERRMNALIQREVRAGRIRPYQGVRLLEQYREAFAAYTYLDGTPSRPDADDEGTP
jgi:arginine decarboxylase